jgi:hypothetical protein
MQASQPNAGHIGISPAGNPHPQASQMQLSQVHFPQMQNPYVQPSQMYTFPTQAPQGLRPQMQFHPMGYNQFPQGGAYQPIQMMTQPQWYPPFQFNTSDQAVAPNALPFTYVAKDQKPHEWGVMKIENVRNDFLFFLPSTFLKKCDGRY